MFNETYGKIRTIATVLLTVTIITAIFAFVSSIMDGEYIFLTLFIGIIVILSAYELALYMHSYADLVENSFSSKQLQGSILKTLKSIEEKLDDSNYYIAHMSNLAKSNVNNNDTQDIHVNPVNVEPINIEPINHWSCSKCGKRNSLEYTYCSKCGRSKS